MSGRKHVDTSEEWITMRTGIKSRRIAADDESTADLALAAARSALDDAGLRAEEIDEIIVASDTPEVYLPDTACFVQHRLGAREIPAYDLGNSGCAGFLLALDIARMRAQFGVGRILVIGAELLTRLMSWRDRETCVLFGDAAAAAVVGQAPGLAKIISAVAGTDGSQSHILTLEVGGTRSPFTLAAAEAGRHQQVVMNGREIFKAAVRRMSEASSQVLAQANFTVSDVSLVIPHQANLRSLKQCPKSLGSPWKDFSSTSRNMETLAQPQCRWRFGRLGKTEGLLRETWFFSRPLERAFTGPQCSCNFDRLFESNVFVTNYSVET